MKIAVINTPVFPVFPPYGTEGYSGLEVLAWQQAEGLAKKGHEVVLFAADSSVCEHAQIFHTGPPGQHTEAQAYVRYREFLSQFDAVLDHSWNKHSYLLKAEGGLKAPVLGVCHAPMDTMFRTPPPVEKPCIVCISEDHRRHGEALFAPLQARVCYNGVDLDLYKPLDTPRSGRFLFLARFSSVKGPDLAIDACRQAGSELDLVGDTKLTGEAEYLQSILHKADGRQIRFVGPASRGNCVWWFSQAHCLIHANQRFREPFGLAPVEAMACGCPVIAWRYGAMPETIGPGCGWLVTSSAELAEAVRQAASGVTETIRKQCREWASQFSVQRMIDRYDELIREAVDSPW